MSSMALDVVTMVHALRTLNQRFLGTGTHWQSHTPAQDFFLDMFDNYGSAVGGLPGLCAVASTRHSDLNAVLTEHGYEPKFRPFDGVGVVSLLDILVEWLVTGKPVDGLRWDKGVSDMVAFPAFQLPRAAVEVFKVPGSAEPLLKLGTKSGYDLWLMAAERPGTGIDLVTKALDLLHASRSPVARYDGAVVPMLDLRVDPDIEWMIGLDAKTELDGYHAISQAFQTVHIRANQHGARGKAMTGMATTRGGPAVPQPYLLNSPFVGFFTYEEVALPQCVFYADPVDWKAPADLD